MRKRFAVSLLSFFLLLPRPAVAHDVVSNSAMLKSKVNNGQDFDIRYFILKAYLSKKNSPLAGYAKNFIEAADQNSLDWRFLPAITGLESSFGKRLIKGNFNPFGWDGGYFCFDSWPDGIDYVGKALTVKPYPQKMTPEAVGPIYAPPNPNWGGLVRNIMNQIVALP